MTGKFWITNHNKQKQRSQPLRFWKRLAGGLLVLSMVVDPGQAQQPTQQPAQQTTQSVRVVTRLVSPFVFEENSQLAGFSIDLWQSIAQEMKLESKFIVKPTVADLLSTVKSGEAEIGIAAISITAKREEDFDFSQPMFESGLQILVREQSNTGGSAPQLLTAIFSPALLQLIGIVFVLVLIPAHLIWFFERRHPDGMVPEKAPYFPGIFEAFWWAASTLATQADTMPKGPLSRIMAVVWMFAGVVFVAYFTATVTTSLTVQQLQGNIKGPEDLPGKRVATTAGSTSANYLRQKNIPPKEFPQIKDAYDALSKGQVDAVVFDAPVLLYYASHEGKGKVQVVGSVFRKESYGIVLPPKSPYRKPINSALLNLQENGTYQKLYEKWFSDGN